MRERSLFKSTATAQSSESWKFFAFYIWAQDILSLIRPNINGDNFENGGSLIDNPILWRSSDSDRLNAFY
jgi:hypothetical protein